MIGKATCNIKATPAQAGVAAFGSASDAAEALAAMLLGRDPSASMMPSAWPLLFPAAFD